MSEVESWVGGNRRVHRREKTCFFRHLTHTFRTHKNVTHLEPFALTERATLGYHHFVSNTELQAVRIREEFPAHAEGFSIQRMRLAPVDGHRHGSRHLGRCDNSALLEHRSRAL